MLKKTLSLILTSLLLTPYYVSATTYSGESTVKDTVNKTVALTSAEKQILTHMKKSVGFAGLGGQTTASYDQQQIWRTEAFLIGTPLEDDIEYSVMKYRYDRNNETKTGEIEVIKSTCNYGPDNFGAECNGTNTHSVTNHGGRGWFKTHIVNHFKTYHSKVLDDYSYEDIKKKGLRVWTASGDTVEPNAKNREYIAHTLYVRYDANIYQEDHTASIKWINKDDDWVKLNPGPYIVDGRWAPKDQNFSGIAASDGGHITKSQLYSNPENYVSPITSLFKSPPLSSKHMKDNISGYTNYGVFQKQLEFRRYISKTDVVDKDKYEVCYPVSKYTTTNMKITKNKGLASTLSSSTKKLDNGQNQYTFKYKINLDTSNYRPTTETTYTIENNKVTPSTTDYNKEPKIKDVLVWQEIDKIYLKLTNNYGDALVKLSNGATVTEIPITSYDGTITLTDADLVHGGTLHNYTANLFVRYKSHFRYLKQKVTQDTVYNIKSSVNSDLIKNEITYSAVKEYMNSKSEAIKHWENYNNLASTNIDRITETYVTESTDFITHNSSIHIYVPGAGSAFAPTVSVNTNPHNVLTENEKGSFKVTIQSSQPSPAPSYIPVRTSYPEKPDGDIAESRHSETLNYPSYINRRQYDEWYSDFNITRILITAENGTTIFDTDRSQDSLPNINITGQATTDSIKATPDQIGVAKVKVFYEYSHYTRRVEEIYEPKDKIRPDGTFEYVTFDWIISKYKKKGESTPVTFNVYTLKNNTNLQ